MIRAVLRVLVSLIWLPVVAISAAFASSYFAVVAAYEDGDEDFEEVPDFVAYGVHAAHRLFPARKGSP